MWWLFFCRLKEGCRRDGCSQQPSPSPPPHTHTHASPGLRPTICVQATNPFEQICWRNRRRSLIFVFKTRSGYIWLQSRRPRKTLCFLWEKKGELHLVSTFSLLTRGRKHRWGEISLTAGWLVAFRGAWSWSSFRHLSLQVQERFFCPPFFRAIILYKGDSVLVGAA